MSYTGYTGLYGEVPDAHVNGWHHAGRPRAWWCGLLHRRYHLRVPFMWNPICTICVQRWAERR